MKKYFEILKKSPLFEGIADENLSGLLSCLDSKAASYKKSEAIISEGEQARFVGIVLSGTVQIESTDYFGNRNIVGIASASELFGESFACAGVDSIPVSVIAREDCTIMLIDSRKITLRCQSSCDFHGQMIFNLMRVLAKKNLNFHKKLEISSKRSTREKLLAYLQTEAKQKDSASFDIPYDRQALADYLGVERSGLSQEIAKLRREGVLKSQKNHFELL